MKKLIVLLLSIFVVMNIFATTGTIGETVDGSSEATLNLTLENQYKFAFIAAADGGTAPSIGTGPVTPLTNFTLHTTGDALIKSGANTTLKLDETRNVFYFYYQAYTNKDNIIITISADNLVNEGNDYIQYTASFETVQNKWDGETLSPSSITSGSDTESSASAKIKKDSTTTDGDDFNYMGLCKVTIDSTEDLGKKKPGNYSANIYLTLTAN